MGLVSILFEVKRMMNDGMGSVQVLRVGICVSLYVEL